MSVQPFYNPKFRAFDSNGDPLSGGKLYTYAAGTTTPLATYTTRAGTVANANPVILDANGEADVWTTPGVEYKLVLKTSAGVTQWTVDNVPSPSEVTDTTTDVAVSPGGRLSLAGTATENSDLASRISVTYMPYIHSKVPLWSGSAWATYSIGGGVVNTAADATKNPAAVAANKVYDLFLWDDAGAVRLSRGLPWTDDTNRDGACDIEALNGRLVNDSDISNGPATHCGLYVGTIRSDGSSQLNDTYAKRHVWNYYNRVARPMRVIQSDVGYNYATNAIRQAGANTANQLDFVVGVSEDSVRAEVSSHFRDAAFDYLEAFVAIGLDSTTTISPNCFYSPETCKTVNQNQHVSAVYFGYPAAGRHTLVWLERPFSGIGTYTWNAGYTTGIFGEILG